MKKWKTISSKRIIENSHFIVRKDAVELPNGHKIDDYYIWEQGDFSLIVPVTENNELVLVKQYKHGVGTGTIEFPAGYLDKKEDPLNGAKRELREETGYSSDVMELIGRIMISPTKVSGTAYIYLAQNVIKKFDISLDKSEDIETIVKPYKEVIEMISKGEIAESSTISAFFLAGKHLNWEI